MFRPHLEMAPEAKWPDRWQLRRYEPAFEVYWLEIHFAAEQEVAVTPETFRSVFGEDAGLLSERQLYLFNEANLAVGTVTAWFGMDFPDKTCGRVHYLAVVPGFQQKGLGKALLGESLRLLKQLGYTAAYLATSSTKLAAIRLYSQAGFEPVVRTPQEQEIWSEIRRECSGAGNRA